MIYLSVWLVVLFCFVDCPWLSTAQGPRTPAGVWEVSRSRLGSSFETLQGMEGTRLRPGTKGVNQAQGVHQGTANPTQNQKPSGNIWHHRVCTMEARPLSIYSELHIMDHICMSLHGLGRTAADRPKHQKCGKPRRPAASSSSHQWKRGGRHRHAVDNAALAGGHDT